VRHLRIFLLILIVFSFGSPVASASSILDGWAINIDGEVTFFQMFNTATGGDFAGTPVDGNTWSVQTAGFSFGSIDVSGGGGQTGGGTGMGDLFISIAGTGTHTITLWLDHSLDEGQGPAYWSDFAAVAGSLPAGFQYTADEPGYGDPNNLYTGTAYAQTAAGTLDNTNHLAFNGSNSPSDVSMAIGMTYTIPVNASGAIFHFLVAGSAPASGFYLVQSSTLGPDNLYFSADVTPISNPVPEPSDWTLIIGGGLVILGLKLRRRSSPTPR
jgi:hypothetical protein